MSKVVIWGAGREGRGFLADIFTDDGWNVVFAENNEVLCKQLKARKQYTLWQCSTNSDTKPKIISGFSVLNPSQEEDLSRLADEVAEASMMALCVYPHQYEGVIKVLNIIIDGFGRSLNKQACDKTLLLGVNETDARKHFLDIAEKNMYPANFQWFCGHVDVAPCIVRRTCTVPSGEYQEQDILGIMTNSYPELIADGASIKGRHETVKGIRYSSDLQRDLTIKLYTYNMLHAVYAYAGVRKGYQTLWEAYSDEEIHARAKESVAICCQAVSKEYGISEDEMEVYQNLMWSYAVCRELGDTIERLAADPLRKLSSTDRIVGPILLCQKHGLDPQPLYKTLLDAVCYLDMERMEKRRDYETGF